MPILSHPAFGPRAALAYITGGAILDIVVVCYYFFMVEEKGNVDKHHTLYFVLTSLFLIGLTLLAIGVLLGRIGQSARRAELPPPEAVNAEAAVQQAQAANMPVVAPPVGAAPMAPVAPAAGVAPVAPHVQVTAPPGTAYPR